jgi:hypothetical protein
VGPLMDSDVRPVWKREPSKGCPAVRLLVVSGAYDLGRNKGGLELLQFVKL